MVETTVVREAGNALCSVRTQCAECGAWNTVDADERLHGFLCGGCEAKIPLTVSQDLLTGQQVDACARCGKAEATDLWIRKDFDPKLGVGIVVVAGILAFWTYGLSLLVATIVDALLYMRLPFVTTCYHCHTEHRGLPLNPAHAGFDLAHQEDIEQDQAVALRKQRGIAEPDDGPVL